MDVYHICNSVCLSMCCTVGLIRPGQMGNSEFRKKKKKTLEPVKIASP